MQSISINLSPNGHGSILRHGSILSITMIFLLCVALYYNCRSLKQFKFWESTISTSPVFSFGSSSSAPSKSQGVAKNIGVARTGAGTISWALALET